MLLEFVVSAAIVVTLLGAVFGLLDPARGAVAAQPQAVDMQQRARAAFAGLQRDLRLAGSGAGAGVGAGVALHRLRAPVAPGGMLGPAGRPADRESVTLFYAPPGGAGAVLADEVPAAPRDVQLRLTPAPGCARPPRCGVDGPGSALVFDRRGRSELLRIRRARGDTVTARRPAAAAGAAFAAGARIAPVVVRGYVFDRRRGQLRRHNGTATTLPFVDGVVALTVRFFGGPLPSLTAPSSVADADAQVAAPCLVTAAGAPRPPGAPPPPLRELPPAELADGPWCAGGIPFDVDLFRVRRVRIEVRLRVADDAWRVRGLLPSGPPGRPGRRGGVADFTLRFDVAPRSLASW